MVLVCGRLSTDRLAMPAGDCPCIECARGTTYGRPHLEAMLLCLCPGLWWPFVKIVSPFSDCAVNARGRDVALVGTAGGDASSESNSGTGSRWSFLRAQEQRPPWLQQHLSAGSKIRHCNSRSFVKCLLLSSPSCVQAPLTCAFSPPQSQRT